MPTKLIVTDLDGSLLQTDKTISGAIDEVKAAADHICDTNDNDGVAKWLEENVL